MPKLATVSQGLADVKRRLEGTPAGLSTQQIKDAIAAAMRDANEATAGGLDHVRINVDAIDTRFEKHLEILMQSFEQRQTEVRKQLFMHVGTILAGLADAIDEMESKLGQLDTALNGSKTALADDVKGSAEALRKAVQSAADRNTAAVNKVEKLIAKLPTRIPEQERVNMTPVIDTLAAILEKLDEPMVVEESRPRQWAFDIQREDFSDKVKRIVARQVV